MDCPLVLRGDAAGRRTDHQAIDHETEHAGQIEDAPVMERGATDAAAEAAEAVAADVRSMGQAGQKPVAISKEVNEDDYEDDDEADEVAWKYRPELTVRVVIVERSQEIVQDTEAAPQPLAQQPADLATSMGPRTQPPKDTTPGPKTTALKLQALYAEQHDEENQRKAMEDERKQVSQLSLPCEVRVHNSTDRDAIIGSSLDGWIPDLASAQPCVSSLEDTDRLSPSAMEGFPPLSDVTESEIPDTPPLQQPPSAASRAGKAKENVDNPSFSSDDEMLFEQVKNSRKRDPTEKDKKVTKLSTRGRRLGGHRR